MWIRCEGQVFESQAGKDFSLQISSKVSLSQASLAKIFLVREAFTVQIHGVPGPEDIK